MGGVPRCSQRPAAPVFADRLNFPSPQSAVLPFSHTTNSSGRQHANTFRLSPFPFPPADPGALANSLPAADLFAEAFLSGRLHRSHSLLAFP